MPKATARELEIDLEAFVYEHDSFFNDIEDLQDEFTNLKRRDIYRPGDKDKVVISVLDTGVGMKRKDQMNLFKMFGTLNNTK